MTTPEESLRIARRNCAAKLRGDAQKMLNEAAAFEEGDRDHAWAMHHELARLEKENSNG